MLYAIFILKNHLFPNFNPDDITSEKCKGPVEELLKQMLPGYGYQDCYEDYYFDILRYLTIYDIIRNDKFIVV